MRTRDLLIGLLLASLSSSASGAPARAEPPKLKVIVATPMLSSDMPSHVRASLERVFDQGITTAGAVPVDRELVAEKAKAHGVAITKRGGAIKVAHEVGAAAILRYRAKVVEKKIHVRATVLFHESGKAVMLEREVAYGDLGTTGILMMKELLGGGGAAAPATEVVSSEASDKPPSTPEEPSTAVAAALGAPNPNARSGLIARFHFGGSAPIGDDSDLLGFGLRLGGELGYQLRLGNIHALTPELAIGFTRWGAVDQSDDFGNTLELDGGLILFSAMAGVRYDLCLGPVTIWPAFRLGFALASADISDPSGTYLPLDDSKGGFALSFGFGAQYMFVPQLGAGIFFDFTKAFAEIPDTNVGTSGFAFGLHVTGKLPL